MKGTTHKVFGMALSTVGGTLLGITPFSISGVLYYGSSYIASTLPDWDIKLKLKHRGITHTLITSIVVSGITYLLTFSFPISIGLLIGYVSHLIGDMFTVSGVPILAPFSKKKFRFPIHYSMGKVKRNDTHPLESIIFILSILVILYQTVL